MAARSHNGDQQHSLSNEAPNFSSDSSMIVWGPRVVAHAGVLYVKAVELPGATMVISDSDLAIEDSVFLGLSYFGQGALVVANSNVTFVNVTFSSCNNSAGESPYWQVRVDGPIHMRTAPESGTGTWA